MVNYLYYLLPDLSLANARLVARHFGVSNPCILSFARLGQHILQVDVHE
jgi:hypothetical protein